MSERNKVKERVIALLEKTTENGCSEHEAMIAMEKAGELMEFYNIELTELKIKNARAVAKTVDVNYRGFNVSHCFVVLANFCDCHVYTSRSQNTATFFGFSEDLEVLEYLYQLIHNAAIYSLEEYKQSSEYRHSYGHGRSLSTSFIHGFTDRISLRLSELTEERRKEERQNLSEETGTALVVLKHGKIEEDYEEYKENMGIRLRSHYTTRSVRSRIAYGSGQSAGSKVNLNTGIGQKSKKALS